MPCTREKKQTFRCSTCKRTITRKAKTRLSAIRRHKRDAHPSVFKQMIAKSVRSRTG